MLIWRVARRDWGFANKRPGLRVWPIQREKRKRMTAALSTAGAVAIAECSEPSLSQFGPCFLGRTWPLVQVALPHYPPYRMHTDTAMDHRTARFEFKRGLMLLRDHRPQAALRHMRRAVALDENKPHYFSYLGVAFALAEKKWTTAELYCHTALRMKHDDAS